MEPLVLATSRIGQGIFQTSPGTATYLLFMNDSWLCQYFKTFSSPFMLSYDWRRLRIVEQPPTIVFIRTSSMMNDGHGLKCFSL